MKKVTYYMYSCDTCCMSRDMMEIDGLNYAKCQKSKEGTLWELFELLMIMRQKSQIVVFFSKLKDQKSCSREKGDAVVRYFISKERVCSFSLDFWPFGPSVLDEARSKVDLRGEGYAWAPIWWSSDNSKR